MRDIHSIPSVTGVDLNLKIAGPGARSYAFIIDWHIRVIAALAWFVVGTLAMTGGFSPDADVGSAYIFAVVLPTVALYFLYHPIVELLMAGMTPGKRIAGVRVVRADGSLPGVGAILIRNIFRLIDSLPLAYFAGLLTTVVTKQQVRIGDIAANTLLVYSKNTDKALDQLSGEAIGRVGMDQLELVRDLLDRWQTLKPEMRGRLARRLLESMNAMPYNDTDSDLREALEGVLHDGA